MAGIKRSRSGELMANLGSFSKKERKSVERGRIEGQRRKDKRDPAAPFRE